MCAIFISILKTFGKNLNDRTAFERNGETEDFSNKFRRFQNPERKKNLVHIYLVNLSKMNI